MSIALVTIRMSSAAYLVAVGGVKDFSCRMVGDLQCTFRITYSFEIQMAFAMYGSVLVEVGNTTAAGTVLVGRILSAEDTK